MRAFLLGLVVIAAVVPALKSHAQGQSDPLPSSLSGRWTVVPPGGRTIIDSWTFEVDGARAPGPVKGRVTWRGRGCGALDEPIAGTWDGTELSFEFKTRPDVNTQMTGATYCGEGKTNVVLRRQAGARDFEGEASMNDGPANIPLTASP